MGKTRVRFDLSNMEFERLKVIKKDDTITQPTMWICECKCGTIKSIASHSLRSGRTKSCGCLHNESVRRKDNRIKKHGLTNTRLFNIWGGMKTRCYNENAKDYYRYGGRGIIICDEWLNDFQAFYDWSMANGYKDDLTIDRKDNDKGYSPDNCKWATIVEQANNQRTNRLYEYNGKSQNMKEWAKEYNLTITALHNRLNRDKWNIERALTTPVRKQVNN